MRPLLCLGALAALLALSLAPAPAAAIDPRVCTFPRDWHKYHFNVTSNGGVSDPTAQSVVTAAAARILKQMQRKGITSSKCELKSVQAVEACFAPANENDSKYPTKGTFDLRLKLKLYCKKGVKAHTWFQVWPSPTVGSKGTNILSLPWDYQILPNGHQILHGSDGR